MDLETLIRDALERGGMISLHKVTADSSGEYGCSVSVPRLDIWASRRDCDPITAFKACTIEFDRLLRDKARVEVAARDPAQLELEDAIAADTSDDFEGLL